MSSVDGRIISPFSVWRDTYINRSSSESSWVLRHTRSIFGPSRSSQYERSAHRTKTWRSSGSASVEEDSGAAGRGAKLENCDALGSRVDEIDAASDSMLFGVTAGIGGVPNQ